MSKEEDEKKNAKRREQSFDAGAGTAVLAATALTAVIAAIVGRGTADPRQPALRPKQARSSAHSMDDIADPAARGRSNELKVFAEDPGAGNRKDGPSR
jgi:hypothetical protein